MRSQQFTKMPATKNNNKSQAKQEEVVEEVVEVDDNAVAQEEVIASVNDETIDVDDLDVTYK